MKIDGIPKIPKPKNAPMPTFAKGTEERELLEAEIKKLRAVDYSTMVLPLVIGGRKVVTEDFEYCLIPHDHRMILGKYAIADKSHIESAIDSVLKARRKWQGMDWFFRLYIFRRAAYLLQTKYFYRAVATTMEDYSKTHYEAMIDVCELIDFLNFNAYYAYKIYKEQPDTLPHNFNITDWRPLEGFVAALPPNNFIAIAGNLPTAPLIMGNVVVCKPASDTVFSFHLLLEILYDAGLPKEVLSVVHGDSQMIGETLLNHPDLSGVHFTGSTDVFNWIVGEIGKNTAKGLYKSYPHRATVGETGGKDFLVVYDDEDPKVVANSIVTGGFGYQGRKCSATSRVYITQAMWERVKPELIKLMRLIKVGDVADFKNFMGAIINEAEYNKIVRYIEDAKKASGVMVLGGGYDSSIGLFVYPTIIETDNPDYITMKKEIFGPVVTVCRLDKRDFKKVLEICDKGSDYGLTGAVNTKDIFKLCQGLDALRYSAGNIYDFKTTGAVVGQQPFGGARKSGTNDKAGSKANLYRWVSPRTISLLHDKPSHFTPPYLNLEEKAT